MPAQPISKENTPRDSADIAISVRDLRVRYGTREILHGVNFEVPAGETLVIMGGSGCGKSTLLRTLVGLELPSEGEIWIQGKNFAGMTGAERDELWAASLKQWPNYDVYQSRTERKIPVVVVERV